MSFGRVTRLTRLVAIVGVLVLVVTFGVWWLLRDEGRTVTGYFSNAAAVFEGNDVRVLGVPVGRITSVEPAGQVVRIEMLVEDSVPVPVDANAVVVSPSLVTGRYIQLTPPYTGGPRMADGAQIPLQRTAVPLGVDDLTRTVTELSTVLGPDGVNRDGTLADLLDVGAQNLDGNGQAVNDTIGDLARLTDTLAGSREDLFGTVTELQSFVATVEANDAQVAELTTRLADVSGFLAGERDDLGAALAELSFALGDVAAFVQDNRAVLRSNVDRLTEVTQVLVQQRDALADIADVAPAALGNLANGYNASSGTLDTRSNLQDLTLPPLVTVCKEVRRGTPEGLPPTLAELCAALEPGITGAAGVPPLADVITMLQQGQSPPVPGLVLPRRGGGG
ncbi:MAG: MCE family protein [Actinomycetota bacterium]|nr:MCE family protein [Actinomycetota bacterium]